MIERGRHPDAEAAVIKAEHAAPYLYGASLGTSRKPPRSVPSRSIGNGNTMVELFSPAMLAKVPR